MPPEIPPRFRACVLALLLAVLAGCAGSGAVLPSAQNPVVVPPGQNPVAAEQHVGELEKAILSLGEDIHPGEARRAARIALEYSRQLAREYRVTDSALVHNLKVNLGLRERGLCIDWTSDLMARLRQEDFASLDLHWAIANYETIFRLEHSTVVISARGDSLYRGLVLDAWRNSGDLYWAPTIADSGYRWKPQAEIHALKRQHEIEARNRSALR